MYSDANYFAYQHPKGTENTPENHPAALRAGKNSSAAKNHAGKKPLHQLMQTVQPIPRDLEQALPYQYQAGLLTYRSTHPSSLPGFPVACNYSPRLSAP